MKYTQLLTTAIILVVLFPPISLAGSEEYKIMIYELVEVTRNVALEEAEEKARAAAKEAKRNRYRKAKTTEEPIRQPVSYKKVDQPLRILSGKFQIQEIPEHQIYNKYSEIRRYKNNLTRLKNNQWKIAIVASEASPDKDQEIIQEILRQLNAEEEEKNSNYKKTNISGWEVRIQEDLIDDKINQKSAIKELEHQLRIIRNRLPNRAVKQLQQVPIWIYKDRPGVGSNITAYYSSLYKAVVFHNANKLSKLSEVQNAVVLHEMAHGYHDIVLGYDNLEIIDAYENAIEKGLYQNVETQNGGTASKAYALTDYKEYFAELSESYFSYTAGSFENDYYPFNRYDLQKYDKTGYNLAKDMWGK